MCAWFGTQATVLEPGDYFSVPPGLPHKYKSLDGPVLFESYDAPYDREPSVHVPSGGVVFDSCEA
jgi:hypothetical protein